MGVVRIQAAVVAACVVSAGLIGSVPVAAQGAVAAGGERCTQHAAHRPHDEWATCVGVRITVLRAPALGEDATVEVTVSSDLDRPSLAVTLDAPTAMSFVGAAGVRTARSADTSGSVQRVGAPTPLRAGSERTLRYRLHANALGVVHLRAVARAVVAPDRTDAADDDVYLTVGRTAATSRVGAATPKATRSAAVPVAATTLHSAPAPRRMDLVASSPSAAHQVAAPRSGAALPAGQSCVHGGWFFYDQNGVQRPAVNETVQVWSEGVFGGSLLATGVVGWDGHYRLCYINFTTSPLWPGYQEVAVLVSTMNTTWRVRDTATSNTDYSAGTKAVNVADAVDYAFGDLVASAGTTTSRAMNAFDALNKLWSYVHGANRCFDPNDAHCRQMVVDWTPISNDGTYYSTSGNDIHLAAADPNAPTTVIHEASHALMDDLYEDAFPSALNCTPHSIFGVTSTGCAWTEGYAEWLPAMVLNDPYFRWPNGASVNLETPTWIDGRPTGDAVEGRVAGTMIDISDSTNEQPWDVGGEGFAPQWNTLVNQVSGTLREFLTSDRPVQGYLTDDSFVLAAAYQNTIYYTFRDPLPSGVVLNRPATTDVQSHSFVVPSNSWSVVGERPAAGSDYDLLSFNDRSLATMDGISNLSSDAVDFIAYNGNGVAARTVYPQAARYYGTGGYTIEGVSGGPVVGSTATTNFGVGDMLDVWNTMQPAGAPVFYRVVPLGPLDVSIHLMSSEFSGGHTAIGRGLAAASSDAGGAGVEEALIGTEITSTWDGLVIVNKTPAVSGSVVIYRDYSAPTASVVIGAGDPAATNTASVTLAIAGADPDTGVRDMRISTDGVLDSEPWVPFAPSVPVTLPGGAGTKTVSVQIRNNANIVTTVSDSIRLDPSPNLVVTSTGAPPATVAQGAALGTSANVQNTGTAATVMPTAVDWYLSLDTVFDPSDVLLGGAGVGALAAGATNGVYTTEFAPVNTPPGVYHLIACVDPDNVIAEFSESDNCQAAPTTTTVTGPDYVVSALSDPPAVASRGTAISVTDSTKNVGIGPAMAISSTRYLLSLNKVLDPSDTLLRAAHSVPALAAGRTSSATKSVVIPKSIAHGTYYVLACADYGAVLAESNESNNCRASVATITV